MKTVSVSEFRNNIKQYLDFSKTEKVIIHRGKGLSYAIIPIEEIEDSPYDPEFVKSIFQAREDSKNGKGVKIAIDDLWK
ncbi:MAG: hypothetical protein QG594_452 [Bacteroidota bacterium]|nr:hypothetical protein [Bacteroidota bacterium]